MGRLRQIQSIGAVVLLLCTTLPVSASSDEFFRLKPLPDRLIPEYTPCTYKNSQFACFDKAQVLELYRLEVRAKYWHDQWINVIDVASKKDTQIGHLQAQIAKYIEMQQQDQVHIEGLNNKLADEIEKKNEYRAQTENPPTWPYWLGGGLALLGVGAFLGALFN